MIEDIEWRFRNLYWIKDELGQEVPFQEFELQRHFRHNLHWRNLVLKDRQIGITTEIFLLGLDLCLFTPNQTFAVICSSLKDAVDLVENKIMFAYERLPPFLRKPFKVDNTLTKELQNGSKISVGTSFRSGTVQLLNVTEFARICADDPKKAQEIKTGALNTAHVGTMIIIDSTPRGYEGHFMEMAKNARASTAQGRCGMLDWRFHFYAWYQDARCQLVEPEVITPRHETYFEKLKAEHHIELSDHQKWWYVAKEREQKDYMRQEYPSTPNEAFEQVIEGAYYEREMLQARKDGRIGGVPHDPALLVHTAWDIGTTAVWFFQMHGQQAWFIRYEEFSNASPTFYARELRRIAEENGYEYGRHIGPHDLEARGQMGEDIRIDAARKAGIEFDVVPRIKVKADAIAIAGDFINRSLFDESHCERGIQALQERRRHWNSNLSRWENYEAKGWWCHACDAYEQASRGVWLFLPGVKMAKTGGLAAKTARPNTLPKQQRVRGHYAY